MVRMKNFSLVVSSLREPLKVLCLFWHVKPRHDEFIEVAYECRKQKKHRVFSHEGFWKPVPAESVIHFIEDAFLPSTEVIEFDNLFLGRLVVICKDAAVGVFSFPQVEFAVYPLLSLNHKTVCLPFPFLDENGGQLKLNAAQFHFLPTSECKDVIVERTASVGTDIEGLAVFSNLFHYLFRTRAAISSETVDNKLVLFKPFKEPLQRVLLVETDICVAVAVLNADNQVANNCHARAITKELLVCRLCIILLTLFQLVRCKHTIEPSPSFSCPVDNRQLRSSVFSLSAVLKS